MVFKTIDTDTKWTYKNLNSSKIKIALKQTSLLTKFINQILRFFKLSKSSKSKSKTKEMFGSSSANKDTRKTVPISSLKDNVPGDGQATTVIAKGSRVEGKFICPDNVRLDGTIVGEVRVEKRLVMGDSGHVQGNIWAKEAAVRGKIKGDIVVGESLHLLETASIEGNITARTMIVEEGARYNGACKIGETGTPIANQPLSKN